MNLKNVGLFCSFVTFSIQLGQVNIWIILDEVPSSSSRIVMYELKLLRENEIFDNSAKGPEIKENNDYDSEIIQS